MTLQIQFGEWCFEPDTHQLSKDEYRETLEPRVARLLEFFIANPEQVLSPDRLVEAVWDGRVVSDEAIRRCVSSLRRALAKGGSADFIRTVSKAGYIAKFPPPPEPLPTPTPGDESLSLVGEESDLSGAMIRSPVIAGFTGRRVGAAVGVVLLVVVAVTVWLLWPKAHIIVSAPVSNLNEIKSLAVLPLENLSGDPEEDYFADGMTEALITDLAKVSALKVISRTSVMRFKGTTSPLPEVAQALNVDGIIEGSVQREGKRVRVTAQLIDGRTDENLWAESYERDLSSVLALQADVATAIVDQVRVAVSPEERTRLASARPVNPQAYENYLKGMQYWNSITPQGMNTALEYFQLALKKDPNSARAYAGIAAVWAGRQQMGLIPPAEAAPKAKAAALEAVRLDATLADAHFALATVLAWSDWNWAGAEREFQKAIELNPSFAYARAYYSHYLMTMRRPAEGLTQMRRALELDPFNGLYRALYAVDLLWVGRYDDAITQARQAMSVTPGNLVANTMLWYAYSLKGMDDEAVEAAMVDISVYADATLDQILERSYAEGGYALAMLRVADALAIRSRTSLVGPLDIASFYLLGGDKVRALDWVEKMFETRDPNIPYLGLPVFDSVRSEPRFKAIVRGVHLPQ